MKVELPVLNSTLLGQESKVQEDSKKQLKEKNTFHKALIQVKTFTESELYVLHCILFHQWGCHKLFVYHIPVWTRQCRKLAHEQRSRSFLH